MVLREWPVTRAVAEMLTPSTRRLATCSNSRRVQRRPLYAVPVFVLTVPLQTVHRYRRRRPDFVANEPWLTMLKPGCPRLSHPGVAHAIPSITLIAQVYRGGSTVSEVKLTDQQRPAQAPDQQRFGDDRPQTAGAHEPRKGGDQVDEQDEQVTHRHILATSPEITKLDTLTGLRG